MNPNERFAAAGRARDGDRLPPPPAPNKLRPDCQPCGAWGMMKAAAFGLIVVLIAAVSGALGLAILLS